MKPWSNENIRAKLEWARKEFAKAAASPTSWRISPWPIVEQLLEESEAAALRNLLAKARSKGHVMDWEAIQSELKNIEELIVRARREAELAGSSLDVLDPLTEALAAHTNVSNELGELEAFLRVRN